MSVIKNIAAMGLLLFLSACGGGGSTGDSEHNKAAITPVVSSGALTNVGTVNAPTNSAGIVEAGGNVTADNQPASLVGIPATQINVGSTYRFAPIAADANGDKLLFYIFNLPSWMQFDPETGVLAGKPSSTDVGVYENILIKVSDGLHLTWLPAFNLTVLPLPNHAPSISGSPAKSVYTFGTYQFTPTASDADGDKLAFSVANLPAWMTFDPATGTLSGWAKTLYGNLFENIVISVSDGKITVSLPPFSIRLEEPPSDYDPPAPAATNRPPVISGVAATTVYVGRGDYEFIPTASDPDNDPLTFSIANLPAWARFDPATGKLSGTPNVLGSTGNITISVSDGRGGTDSLVFAIEVVAPIPLTRDTDNDGEIDAVDTDDDNDNVPDNEDFRPLDASITVPPTYTAKVNSHEQTYVKMTSANGNFSTQSPLDVRSLNGNFATPTLLYFDIPTVISSKRVDNITKATLTVKSKTESDVLNIHASTAVDFPSAANATWNNSNAHFGTVSYGQIDVEPETVGSTVLGQPLSAGKIVFVIDETGNSKGELYKGNAENYLDLEFQEVDPVMVNVVPVVDSRATQAGGELKYAITLAQAPTHDVYVPLKLSEATTATLTSSDILVFTPANYNVPQTVVIQGKDDGSNTGTKSNKLLMYPLHSNDATYNGVNPPDHDFNVYASLPDANSGEAWHYPVDFTGTDAQFSLENAPVGMNINAKTGVITWQPDSSEVGSHDFSIIAKIGGALAYNKAVNLTVKLAGSNPTDALYVVPGGTITAPVGALGSIGNPYTSIVDALTAAGNSPTRRTVYVRGGSYADTAVSIDNIQGAEGNEIILTHLPGERVKFEFSGLSAFAIGENANYLVIDGFEVDGKSVNDHWDMLANHWWDPFGDRTIGGGQAFNVDGQHITIKNNVIHDTYQKGVNIYKGRYVNVQGNLVYNIGHSSLSGGHGIMRKWERNFHINPTDGVDLGEDVYSSTYPYRFDITGNLLLAVEQRIYSRVFNKGYSNLTIDEGKPMAFDETQDTDPQSRVSHNLVLYGGIDHIRLKQNPNMEVYNNSVLPDLTRTDIALDGITDKTKLKNLQFYNNLVASNDVAIDVADSFDAEDADPTVPAIASRKHDNYVAGGGTITGGIGGGITNLGGTDASSLFTNPANGDFSSVLGGSVGVGASHLAHLMDLVEEYGVELEPSGWQHNHLRNAETLVDNIPDTVFDTSAYYIGPSSIEEGHQALFLKFVDSDGQWLYDKLGAGGNWGSLSNADLTDASIYDLPNVKIQKCDSCKGAYVFQLVLPHEWFDAHQNDVSVNNGATALVHLDPANNSGHRTILEYSAAGKVRSY